MKGLSWKWPARFPAVVPFKPRQKRDSELSQVRFGCCMSPDGIKRDQAHWFLLQAQPLRVIKRIFWVIASDHLALTAQLAATASSFVIVSRRS